MEGITNLEHSALGVSLDSGPMEWMLCPEPSEQSVPNSCLLLNHKPVMNPVHDSALGGQLREAKECEEYRIHNSVTTPDFQVMNWKMLFDSRYSETG